MTKSTMPYVYFHKKIIPAEEATVSIGCNSLQYGTTCFAGIRGYVRQGKVSLFRLKDHHERLMNASKILGFGFQISYDEFEKILGELIIKNKPQTDFYIRPFILAPNVQLAPKPIGLEFELAIYFVELSTYFDQTKGMRLMVSSWRKFSDAAIPTKAKAGGCYVNSFMATSEALRCGYDEALVTDESGHIVEASVANILIRSRDRLITPPIGSALLEGITLRTMTELLQEEGIEVHYESIDRSMIYTCNELMLLGTAAQVTFAQSVDDRALREAPGPICKLLREKFKTVIEGNHSKSNEWLTHFKT